MANDKIQQIIDSMDPHEAALELGLVAKKLLSLLDEDARQRFLVNLIGESDKDKDKESSLAHF